MAYRKQHVIWSGDTTYCGRSAREGDVHSPEEAEAERLCTACAKSYSGSHVPSNIYNTTGAPR